MAMPPVLSIAALPIQRKSFDGANVPCWKSTGAAEPRVCPVAFRNSYQRIPEPVPLVTEWLITRASWVAEAPITQAIHQSISECIETRGGSRLYNTRAATACPG